MSLRWRKDIQPLLDKGLYDEIDLKFQKYCEIYPNDSITHSLYGYFLHYQREYIKSEELFCKSLKLDNNNVLCMNYYTDVLCVQKKWKQAKIIALKAFNINNERSWTIGSLCNVLRHLNDINEVTNICQHAIKIYKKLNDTDMWLTLADSCWDLKLYDISIKLFEIGLKKNPKNLQLRDAYSEMLIELNKNNEAIKQLNILLQYYPNNFNIYTDLGYILREMNEYENAKICYLKALKLNFKHCGAHNNLGFLLLHNIINDLKYKNKYNKIIDLIEYHLLNAIKYDNKFPNPYRHLGDFYRI